MAITRWAYVLTLAGVVPILIWPSTATMWWWLLLVIVLVGVDVALAQSPRRLVITRQVPHSVRRGEPCESILLVHNVTGRRMRGLLRDAWQPSAGVHRDDLRHRLLIPAGERRRFVTRLQPTRRGDRRADHVAVRLSGPLHLGARQRSLPTQDVLRVLPPFGSRKHLPSRLARLREIEGLSAVQVRGQGTEFDSLRDYVDGDDVRSIDWRGTARRQRVVVRTWRPERDRRVLILLDTSRVNAARVGDEPRLDAAMDAGLLLAALATRAGDRVDFVAMDRVVRARVTGARGPELMGRLVQAMAPLEAELLEADWVAIATEVRARLTQRALVVLLTPLDAAAAEEGLLTAIPALTQRHKLVIAGVADPSLDQMAQRRGSATALFDAAAAERSRLDAASLTAHLTRAGADVVTGDPETLPPRLADRYLALKAAGQL